MPEKPDIDDADEGDVPATSGMGGFMVYVAVVLIVILIGLVIFTNIFGQSATASSAITRNSWTLASYAGDDGNQVLVPESTKVTALFTQTNTVSGSGSCSTYSARYLISQTIIVISAITETPGTCADSSAAAFDKQYYEILERSARLQVHNNTLTMYSTEGNVLLTYTAA